MVITLRGEGMTLRRALLSIIKATNTEYRLKEGGIEVSGGRLASGSRNVVVDVRDLRAAGLETGWEERLLTSLRRHRAFIDHFREFERFKPWDFFGDHGGLLWFDVPCHSSDQANETVPFDFYVKPILAHLNKLREERGLPRGAE